MALKVKVGLLGPLDMLKFKNQAKRRNEAIAKASSAPLPDTFGSNMKAAGLHPDSQNLVVSRVEELSGDVKSYTLKRKDGGPLAFFRSGQYLSVALSIGKSRLTRPYSLCSSPADALKGEYAITVQRSPAGFASSFILDNWKTGTEVTVSGPQGEFYYEGMRDAPLVIGLAGGSGITPFLSMAKAIRDGDEDFSLTILYGTRTRAGILFGQEFGQICRDCARVRMVNILSDEKVEGMDSGFITADVIEKYSDGNPFSVFVCGPQAMYKFLDRELPKLNLERKFMRRELFGQEKEPWLLDGYPRQAKGKEFRLQVLNCGRTYEVPTKADEPVLVALERAGIPAPSHCRSGECGFCHSRLVSGTVFVPPETDGRRAADLVFGYIHPCSSFPTSDLTIELPGTIA